MERAEDLAERSFRLGDVVYSRALEWCATCGSQVRERYGVDRGFLGSPRELTVRKAARPWECRSCRAAIEKGRLHGSAYYAHYCLACVTPERPAEEFRAETPGPAGGRA